jgi:subtilisin family serine protease
MLAFAATAALLPHALRPTADYSNGGSAPRCGSAQAPAGRVIVLMKQGRAGLDQRATVLTELRTDGARAVTSFHIIDGAAAIVGAQASCRLARTPGVLAVVPDRPLRLDRGRQMTTRGHVVTLATRPAGTVTEPESLGLTGATAVQAEGDAGQGVLVADIDSGIDVTQPNLQGVLAQDAHGQPLYKDFTGKGLQDSVGHGTGTAGMIVSQGTTTYKVSTTPYYGPIAGDPSVITNFRVLGMAPAAKLIVAKVVDASVPNGGYESWVVSAVQWVVDNHAQIINESFGWQDIPTNKPDPVVMADEAAAKAGVVVCVAAGNSGPGFGTVADPAASGLVVSVGASTMFHDMAEDGFLAPYGKYASDGVASFSSRGPTSDGRISPDLLAPGENGWSVFAVSGPAAGAGVGLFSGTSQATPIVAGAFALALSAYLKQHGTAPPSGYLQQLLMNTADDLGLGAGDESAGRVDVARAVAAIDVSGPDVSIGPTSLAFTGSAGTTVQRTVTLVNHGTSAVTIGASAFTEAATATRTFSGTTPASKTGAATSFAFTVPAGTDLLQATAIWRTTDNQPLLLEAFDPAGRLVQYSGGGGIAAVVAAHPAAGQWHIFVGNQNTKAEPFQLDVSTVQNTSIGKVSPSSAIIAAGGKAVVKLSLTMPQAAGRTVDTMRITVPGGAETIPVITTVALPASGDFAGSFVSPSSSGLDSEVYTYDTTVPTGAQSLRVDLSWTGTGNGLEVLLVGPNRKVVARSSYSLTNTTTSISTTSPPAGAWQVIVTCPAFAGTSFSVPYTGNVSKT